MIQLTNLFKTDISGRNEPGHWSSAWLKNCAAGCQHPFRYQECFISFWTTSPPQQERWWLPFTLHSLPTQMQLALQNFSDTHRRKVADLNSICDRWTQTSSLRLLVWKVRLHCCSMWEKSCSALSVNRVHDFSCGWIQLCNSMPGSCAHTLDRQRISDKPLCFMLSSACTPSQHAVLAWQPKECGFWGHPCILCKLDAYVYLHLYAIYMHTHKSIPIFHPLNLSLIKWNQIKPAPFPSFWALPNFHF